MYARAEGGRDRHGRTDGREDTGTPEPVVDVAIGTARRMLRAWEAVKSPRFGLEGSLKSVLDDGGVVCGARRVWKIIPQSHKLPAPLVRMEY